MRRVNRSFYYTFYFLSRGWAWLRVSNKSLSLFQWKLPVVITAIILPIMIGLNLFGDLDIFSKSGLIYFINSTIVILPGFFITSLAAIVSLPNPALDQQMPTETTLHVLDEDGASVSKAVTRRHFLSLLFSYLTVQSFFSCAIAITSINLAPTVKKFEIFHHNFACGLEISFILKALALSLYLFVICQIIIATLFALYYLAEKIHHLPSQQKKSGT